MAPIDTNKCYHYHKALTVKDRSAWFDMEREDIKEALYIFIRGLKGNRNIKQCIKKCLREK